MHEEEKWYAMRVTYGRVLKAKEYIDCSKIENFIPMKHQIVVKKGKKMKMLLPAISNLLFVKGQVTQIKEVIAHSNIIKFIYNREQQRLSIPNIQMEHFIKMCSAPDEETIYFDPAEINLKKGTLVRIHCKGQPMDGAEGVFVKIEGKRNKRIVVTINGIIAVARAVSVDLIERIDTAS